MHPSSAQCLRRTFLAVAATVAVVGGCDARILRATLEKGPVELDDPAAWYPLENPARIGADGTGLRADALFMGVVIVDDERMAKVAEFQAGWLAMPRVALRDFTISFWLKTTQQGPKQAGWVMGPRLVDADVSGLALDFGISLSLDRLVFGVGDPNDITADQTAMQSLNPVVDGTWHHVAVTRDGNSGQRQIFIDGALDSQMPALPGALSLPLEFLVGRRMNTVPPSPPLHARMCDLRFYDRVLSSTGIAAMAASK